MSEKTEANDIIESNTWNSLSSVASSNPSLLASLSLNIRLKAFAHDGFRHYKIVLYVEIFFGFATYLHVDASRREEQGGV